MGEKERERETAGPHQEVQEACPGFIQELGVLKRGSKYLKKNPDSISVQVGLPRERTNMFPSHYQGIFHDYSAIHETVTQFCSEQQGSYGLLI